MSTPGSPPRREEVQVERGHDDVPSVSPSLLRWFHWYSRGYLKRNFHGVRVSRSRLPVDPGELPLLVYLNHPSWWDPLVCLVAAIHFFPERKHYAPIDAEALGNYRLLGKLGFFPLDSGSPGGVLSFLRTAQAIMRQPGSSLWLTPQGRFQDPRERPIGFRPGLAHLVRRLDRCVVLPLAIEYVFWEQRTPEALLQFGEPLELPASGGLSSTRALSGLLEKRLEGAQEELATLAIRRQPEPFLTLIQGAAGVGGFYDLWRRFRASLSGRSFQVEHRE